MNINVCNKKHFLPEMAFKIMIFHILVPEFESLCFANIDISFF